jgi:hypothetical protein
MKRMANVGFFSLLALAAFAMAAAGAAPVMATAAATPPATDSDAPATDARVSVTYANPENFSEVREFGQQDRFNDSNYLKPLKAHLIKRAEKMLPAGDRLEVTITDIKLAGGYEPWHGPNLMHVRFMKDIYPPRIDLTFRLIGSNGTVLREGSRKLRKVGYLQSGLARPGDTDPLRYDKGLLDSWLRKGPANL